MNLLDLTPAEATRAVADWIAGGNEAPFRTGQIMRRLWQQPAATWADVTDLPLALRASLDHAFSLPRPRLAARQQSQDGTIKFLWELDREGAVESVLIPEGKRRTLCISSQAGCAYGCVFCATGRMGFRRHLAPWEITAQVRELVLDPHLPRPTHIVFMGMGEPLHNWANVDRALTILNDPWGLGVGARHITVSTIGIIPNLGRLAQRPEQFRLALSLHAGDSETRARLMPVERKYPLPHVLEALHQFRRRVTFEYVLIGGVNDRPADADRLAELARPLGAHINLLPLHPGGAPHLTPATPQAMAQFARRLRGHGVRATLRRSRGLDISAACGQLRIETDRRREVGTEQHGQIEQEPRVGLDHD